MSTACCCEGEGEGVIERGDWTAHMPHTLMALTP